jgi:hypothetical protein
VLTLPLPVLAANNPWDDTFYIQLGAFSADASTTMRLDSEGGRFGTTVTFEGTLGGDERKTLPTFDFMWRANPRHGMEGSFVALHREGSRTITGSINWGEVTFPVNTAINSKFDSDTIRIAYRYSPWHDENGELGFLLGAHYTKLKASLSTPAGTISQEAHVDFPLPTIGVRGAARFAENWHVTGFAQVLKVKIGDYDGELYNMGAAVEWAFSKNLLAGLGYDYYKYNLVSEKSHARGEFDYRFDGPKLYVGWSF